MAFIDAHREADYQLKQSAKAAKRGDWLGAMGHAVWLQDYGAAMLRFAVAEARAQGASWQTIADELGVSRQSAHERFHDADTQRN